MEGGLVHNRASEGGGAVVSGGEDESVEPRRPPGFEATGEADLVPAALVRLTGGGRVHGVLLVSDFTGFRWGGARLDIRKLEAEVVKSDHILW